jgi:hypothetical protein
MSVDVLEQLRVLGERLERDSPPVRVDEVLSRLRPTGSHEQVAHVALESVVVEPAPHSRRRGRVRRHPALATVAAVLLVAGVVGLVVAANRSGSDRANTTESTRDETRGVLAEPAVFPVVGDQPGPRDFGNLILTSEDSPQRVSALVARRNGDTLRDSLWITATAGTPIESPAGTAPAEAVGAQRFDIHGRTAEVWTEPFEVPVQHVRFDGEPKL